MRYFQRLATGIDVSPMLAEIRTHRARWYEHQVRRETVPVQAQTNDIALRLGTSPRGTALEESHAVRESANWPLFPAATAFLEKVATTESGELARAQLVRLKPQGRVLRHIDHGAYYACRDRYHLVLHSVEGSDMRAGDEHVVLRPGELWCFDNRVEHEAWNRSADWRIHLIFDLRPLGRPLRFASPG